MSERRHPNVVNFEEARATDTARGKFGARRRRLSSEARGSALGCSHYEVEPGKTAFPYHLHHGQEEALYILEGAGTLRLGQESIPVRAGDYVACLPGAAPHALTNSGDRTMRYLALSSPPAAVTMDIVTYPDSEKIGLAAGAEPQKGLLNAALLKIIKEEQPKVDYYDDEPLAQE